jgi:hypothetical protein
MKRVSTIVEWSVVTGMFYWMMIPTFRREQHEQQACDLIARARFHVDVWRTVADIRNLPER